MDSHKSLVCLSELRRTMVDFEALPEGCIAAILSRTTPRDVCRLSSVSKTFCSAANSDAVWVNFIPSGSHFLISSSPTFANAPSKKALYLLLSRHPILTYLELFLDCFLVCYMLAARYLSIGWGDYYHYWKWITMPGSRFPEVAQLLGVWWLDICGSINTSDLSPNTQYAAYLVFKMIEPYGFYNLPVKLSVGNTYGHGSTKTVCLDPNAEDGPLSNVKGLLRPSGRRDGWLEIEMGEFYNSGGLEDEEMELSVVDTNYSWKQGLFLEGIEVRPKEDN